MHLHSPKLLQIKETKKTEFLKLQTLKPHVSTTISKKKNNFPKIPKNAYT